MSAVEPRTWPSAPRDRQLGDATGERAAVRFSLAARRVRGMLRPLPMLKAGIVGLPNVGKSTLFNAVTRSHKAPAENYPFCTIEPNLGVVTVPDPRLDALAPGRQGAARSIPTTIEFVDIAGLVKGASQGEGLGNKFLSHIREVDALVHVVRCFEDADIHHVTGSIDPVRDIEIVTTELVLADLEAVRKRHERVAKDAKRGDKHALLRDGLSRASRPAPQRRPARRICCPSQARRRRWSAASSC